MFNIFLRQAQATNGWRGLQIVVPSWRRHASGIAFVSICWSSWRCNVYDLYRCKKRAHLGWNPHEFPNETMITHDNLHELQTWAILTMGMKNSGSFFYPGRFIIYGILGVIFLDDLTAFGVWEIWLDIYRYKKIYIYIAVCPKTMGIATSEKNLVIWTPADGLELWGSAHIFYHFRRLK